MNSLYIQTVTINTNLDLGKNTYIANATGGSFTLTLPNVTGFPSGSKYYIIKRTDSTIANTLTLAATATTINGAASVDIPINSTTIVILNAGVWELASKSSFSFESKPIMWTPNGTMSPAMVQGASTQGIELIKAANRTTVCTVEFPLSANLDVNPILPVKYFISTTGGVALGVQLQLEARYITTSELVTKAVDETILSTLAVTNTLNRMDVVNFTLNRALISPGDTISFALTRLTADVADTFTGRIAIIIDGKLTYSI